MAVSTLSPPFTITPSSTASSTPKLHHHTASLSFPTTTPRNHISHEQYKWRTHVSFFTSFLNSNKTKNTELIKEKVIEAIAPLDRGAEATPQDQQTIDQIARKLEAVNPTKEPLKFNLLNGKWELIYTNSQSILQTQRPKFLRSKINYEAINGDTLRAQNMESGPFFNQVTADLHLWNSKKIPVKAPDRARGELEITYLDEELRISRGDKGNLFILKMVDPSYRISA